MISDDERRELARRLRAIEPDDFNSYSEEREFVEKALGIWDDYDKLLWHVVADLIEPSEPKVKCVAEVKVDGERLEELVHDAALELTGIDRDALLALADEMDAYSGHFSTGLQECTVQAWAVAIREALGVSDG